jgi:hypothetical protein
MVKTSAEFCEDLRRDIARWQADAASARTLFPGLAAEIQKWIDEGARLLAVMETNHAPRS